MIPIIATSPCTGSTSLVIVSTCSVNCARVPITDMSVVKEDVLLGVWIVLTKWPSTSTLRMGVSPVCRLASSIFQATWKEVSIYQSLFVTPEVRVSLLSELVRHVRVSLPTRCCSHFIVAEYRTCMLGPLKYVVTELAPQERVSGNSKDPSACEPLTRPLKLSVRHWTPGAAAKPIARNIASIMAFSRSK